MIKDYELTSKDEITQLAVGCGIVSWSGLTDFISALPYGRNKNRKELGLVLSEKKGTCSSKHALLKRLPDLNSVPNVKLIMGIYRMNPSNSPKIGNELLENSIEFIPEAHCYLKIDHKRIDFTTSQSDFSGIQADIIQEIEIEPGQVVDFKVNYHKDFMRRWIIESNLSFDFETIWQIREKCIENLSK